VGLLITCVAGGWASISQAADIYKSWPGSNGRLVIGVTDPPGCCNDAVYSMNPDGSGVSRVYSDGSTWAVLASSSPDGSHALIRVSLNGCGPDALALLPLVGGPLGFIDDSGGGRCDANDGDGFYSYDGAQIAFIRSGNAPTLAGVFVMNADGTGVR